MNHLTQATQPVSSMTLEPTTLFPSTLRQVTLLQYDASPRNLSNVQLSLGAELKVAEAVLKHLNPQ